jgi:hypothetical protein
MILAKIREHLTGTIDEGGPDLGIRAYYKGDRVPDWLLARVIDAAHRGHITIAGRNLQLIPDKTWEKAVKKSEQKIKRSKIDKTNKTPWPEVRKNQCLPLTSYLPPSEAERKARLSNYYVLRPREIRAGEGDKCNAGTSLCPPSDSVNKRNNSCLACGESLARKRRGAKHCDAACKQRYYRSKGTK